MVCHHPLTTRVGGAAASAAISRGRCGESVARFCLVVSARQRFGRRSGWPTAAGWLQLLSTRRFGWAHSAPPQLPGRSGLQVRGNGGLAQEPGWTAGKQSMARLAGMRRPTTRMLSAHAHNCRLGHPSPSIVAPSCTDASTARSKPGRSLCMRLPAAELSESSAGQVGKRGQGQMGCMVPEAPAAELSESFICRWARGCGGLGCCSGPTEPDRNDQSISAAHYHTRTAAVRQQADVAGSWAHPHKAAELAPPTHAPESGMRKRRQMP